MKYLAVLLIFFILYPSIIWGKTKIGVSPFFTGDTPKYLTKSYQKIDLFNPFSKILNFISNLFQKKREFNIKIPIPPPPPPPDIVIQSESNQKSLYNNTTTNSSSW